MKLNKSFKTESHILKSIFILTLLFGSRVFAAGEKLYTSLLMNEACGYDTKFGENNPEGINKDVLKILNEYVRPNEVVQADGSKKEVKISLIENDGVEHYGDHAIEFEKLGADILALTDTEDPQKRQMRECMRGLFRQGIREWQGYLNKLSKDHSCGLEMKNEEGSCGFWEAENTFDCAVDKAQIDKFKGGTSFEIEIYSPKQVNPPNKSTCDKTKDGEDLQNFILESMSYLGEINNQLIGVEAEIMNLKFSKPGDNQPEGTICLDGRDCGEKSAEKKNSELAEKAKEKACCDSISENWYSLGFSSVKGDKPTERICKDMMDKEKESESKKIIGECLTRISASFATNAIEGIKDFFSMGWITGLPALIHELTNNPEETITLILKNMIGYDEEVLSCVNGPTKIELGCAMFGKFAGSNFGFGVAMGGVGGVVLGATSKAAKVAMKIKPNSNLLKNSVIEKAAQSSLAKNNIFKSALLGMKKGAVHGTLWPASAIRGGFKMISRLGLKKSAEALVKAPLAIGAGSVGVGAKGIGKLLPSEGTGAAANFGRGFSSMGDGLVGWSKKTFIETIKRSGPKVEKEFADLQKQQTNIAADLAKNEARLKKLTRGSLKDKDGNPTYVNKSDTDKKAISDLQKEIHNSHEAFAQVLKKQAELYRKNSLMANEQIKIGNLERMKQLEQQAKEIDNKLAKPSLVKAKSRNEVAETINQIKANNIKIDNELEALRKAKSEAIINAWVKAGVITGTAAGLAAQRVNSTNSNTKETKKPTPGGGAMEIEAPKEETGVPEKKPQTEPQQGKPVDDLPEPPADEEPSVPLKPPPAMDSTE